MNISKFFIDRPIFAGVLSVLVLLGGLLAMFQLPISEYPEVVPPSVVVRAQYPGANPKVIAETVATPLEESDQRRRKHAVHAAQANSRRRPDADGQLQAGHGPGQGAAAGAEPRVAGASRACRRRCSGWASRRSRARPTLTMVVHLISPNDRYDITYLRNYAILNIKDRLARIDRRG
ncbi:MAG: efflux RND transporter permease subunit [Achromobacter pulmonis]